MSRHLNPCRTCPGKTRHDDRRCSDCRVRKTLGLATRMLFIASVANPAAPTWDELSAGIPLPVWHGADCSCTTCAVDRIPGRQA